MANQQEKQANIFGEQSLDILIDIKRLLILQLLTSGVQATQVASALGVDKRVVSKLVPARKVRKRTKKAG
jgi:hypothetical protein